MATNQMSAEQALDELRTMFPGKVIFLKDEIEWWVEDSNPCRVTIIDIDYPPSKSKRFTGDSLIECMGQIRTWREGQT